MRYVSLGVKYGLSSDLAGQINNEVTMSTEIKAQVVVLSAGLRVIPRRSVALT